MWDKINTPSPYDIWNEAFNKLQDEKKKYGMSDEYWRIWHNEVCPAYRAMTKAHRKIGVGYDTLSCQVLNDMDKPISERKHF